MFIEPLAFVEARAFFEPGAMRGGYDRSRSAENCGLPHVAGFPQVAGERIMRPW